MVLLQRIHYISLEIMTSCCRVLKLTLLGMGVGSNKSGVKQLCPMRLSEAGGEEDLWGRRVNFLAPVTGWFLAVESQDLCGLVLEAKPL